MDKKNRIVKKIRFKYRNKVKQQNELIRYLSLYLCTKKILFNMIDLISLIYITTYIEKDHN